MTVITDHYFDVGVYRVTKHEAADIMKMMLHDAKQLAGIYHGQNRSDKFRAGWPDEQKFAAANWKTFIQAVIEGYAAALGKPHVSDDDKRRMYIARLLWDKLADGKEPDNRMQMRAGTQQFAGDPFENRKIAREFGTHAHSRARFMNSIVSRR